MGWCSRTSLTLALGTEWGWSSEFFGFKKWRRLSIEGVWLAPGFCLASVLPLRPGAAQEFSPFHRQMFDLKRQCGISGEEGRMAEVYGEESAE